MSEHTTSGARLISVNTGVLRRVPYRGKQVSTGGYKEPIAGPVRVRRLGIDGDVQADLSVHGGTDKAVYLYPVEHYETWRIERERPFEYGHFGENLTVSGLLEEDVRTGDVLTIADVLLEVTEPRQPCFKLGIKMNDQRFLRRFLESGRSGFYCRVLHEGTIEAGETITLTTGAERSPTIAEVVRMLQRRQQTSR